MKTPSHPTCQANRYYRDEMKTAQLYATFSECIICKCKYSCAKSGNIQVENKPKLPANQVKDRNVIKPIPTAIFRPRRPVEDMAPLHVAQTNSEISQHWGRITEVGINIPDKGV